jgi:hypothetical protein
LRRLIIIGTALTALIAASAAYAVTFFNTYKGSKVVVAPTVAGSKSHPVSVGETEVLKAGSTTSGDRAAPLKDIKTTIYGVKTNGGKLPKCTDAMIVNGGKTGQWDKACPKGSLIAMGPVKALLGSGSDPSIATGGSFACNTILHVYNGGPKTQVFFFTTKTASDCGGLKTGDTAPYDGHISYKGKNLVVNVPLPPDISTETAGHPNLYASLIGQTLVYKKSTKYMDTVACGKGHKRPYSIQFTAQDYNGGNETQTIKGKDKC